jgi:hypothetical protein
VISQALASPSASLTGTDELAAMYQQLNSSVGAFATDTLIADSAALATGSATDDSQYVDEQETLQHLAKARDQLAAEMKVVLAEAAEGSQPSHGTSTSELARGRALLRQAHNLAANS